MTRQENMLLLMCLAHHDTLLAEAIKKAGDHPLFDNLADPCCTFIWTVLRDCRLNTNSYPTQVLVEMEVYSRLDEMLGFEESFKTQVKEILATIYSIGKGNTSVAIGRTYLETALNEALMTDWASNINRITTLDEMRKYVNNVNADIASLSNDGQALIKPLQDPKKYLVKKVRHLFGVRVLDLITGGGLADGEVMGLLGPTGGGKTVLAVGMLCEGAMRKQHVMLATYEQKTEGDVMERICSYMTGESIERFRDKEFEDLEPGLQKKFLAEQAKYSDYVTVLDLAQEGRGAGGADELTQYIEQQIEKGEKPRLVIIDWLGSMIQRYLAETGTDSGQYRHIGHQFIDKIAAHAREHGYSVVINHQLSTEKARASVYNKPKVTDAFEFKAFAYYLDGCVCLGTLDTDTKVGWLCIDKFRRGSTSDIMIKLNGEFVRFELATGYTTDHRGKFIEEDAAPPDVDEELQKKETINEDYRSAFPT